MGMQDGWGLSGIEALKMQVMAGVKDSTEWRDVVQVNKSNFY